MLTTTRRAPVERLLVGCIALAACSSPAPPPAVEQPPPPVAASADKDALVGSQVQVRGVISDLGTTVNGSDNVFSVNLATGNKADKGSPAIEDCALVP